MFWWSYSIDSKYNTNIFLIFLPSYFSKLETKDTVCKDIEKQIYTLENVTKY
jgi:hypothetical protein